MKRKRIVKLGPPTIRHLTDREQKQVTGGFEAMEANKDAVSNVSAPNSDPRT